MGKQSPKKPPHALLRTIGRMIRQHRHRSGGMTQEALAGMVNSNAAYISKIENGYAGGLTVLKLWDISRAVGVPLGALIGDEAPQAVSRGRQPSSIPDAVARIRSLSQRDRGILMETLRDLVEALQRDLDRARDSG